MGLVRSVAAVLLSLLVVSGVTFIQGVFHVCAYLYSLHYKSPALVCINVSVLSECVTGIYIYVCCVCVCVCVCVCARA